MYKKVKIRQQDASDCGAACLASVAAFHGIKLPISRIRQYAGTGMRGTSVQGIIAGAERLSFKAKGVRVSPDKLMAIPLPSIALITLTEGHHHFIVIYSINRKKIIVMDPADGRVTAWPRDTLLKKWNGIIILLRPNEEFRKEDLRASVMRRFWMQIRPQRHQIIQAFVAAVLYTILGLSTSLYLQKIIDFVFVDGNLRLLNLMSTAMILILSLQFGFNYFKSMIGLETAQSTDANLLLGYCRHVLHLPRNFFDNMRIGEIMSRTNDAVKIRIFINDIALNTVVNSLIVVLSLSLMFFHYWKLALVTIGILPFIILLYWLSDRINRIWQRKLMDQSASVESQLIENIQNISTIKYFGLEKLSHEKTESKLISLLKSVYKSNAGNILIQNLTEWITHIFTIMILWIGSRLVVRQELSPGQLLSFYALIGYFTGPAFSLISMNKSLQDALIAGDRLFEILDLETESDRMEPPEISNGWGDIEFRFVHFGYAPGEKVFNDLSFTIRKNSITGIVGDNGSGKSTIASLLTRIYIPERGKIQIGGFDIRCLHLNDLRESISILPQQVDIFADTIIANIAPGDSNPDFKRVVEICRLLAIDEWVEKWPLHYFTRLHEFASGLSGGQKQKIALARALYKKAPCLILDEPNTSLDQSGEQKLMMIIEKCKEEGNTIIIIAHSPDIFKKCDDIIVLKKGQAVEQGTHDQLFEMKGEYFKLCKADSAFLPPCGY